MLKMAIPILRSFDEAKAKEFYLDFLGFSVDWEHRFEPDMPLYMQIRRDDLLLHVSEHHGDCTPGSTVFVVTTDIRAFHAEISAKGYRYNRPGVEEAPWGGLVMTASDPFGNSLRFWQELA
ncbi:MAG: glyoxalase superfamily protein [Kiloniellales bacterium]